MLDNFRDRFQVRTEMLLRRALTGLEKLPPAAEIATKARALMWPMIMVVGLLAGDLAVQFAAHLWLQPPKGGHPAAPPRVVRDPPFVKSKAAYDQVVARNAFCPGCPVPDIKALASNRPKDCGKAKPMPASSLKIIGTIVLSDPQFSVATVVDGGTESTAIKKGDRFKSYGKVFEIRRNRICFEKDDGGLGFIDLPEESIRFGQPLPTAMPTSPVEGIARVTENETEVKRSFLLQKLNDPNLLYEANAVPQRNAAGQIECFKMTMIKPGSVYEALGLNVGDCLAGVNGEPLNSLAKAQELYAAASSATSVAIDIKKPDGGTVTKTFNVK